MSIPTLGFGFDGPATRVGSKTGRLTEVADAGSDKPTQRPVAVSGREELASQVGFLEAEVADLRRRLSDAPGHARALELGSPRPSGRSRR